MDDFVLVLEKTKEIEDEDRSLRSLRTRTITMDGERDPMRLCGKPKQVKGLPSVTTFARVLTVGCKN